VTAPLAERPGGREALAPRLDDAPVRDVSGRLLDGVTWDSTDAEIDEALARRDAEDARNAEALRRAGRLGNSWPEDD
jgi:hypothetical protein